MKRSYLGYGWSVLPIIHDTRRLKKQTSWQMPPKTMATWMTVRTSLYWYYGIFCGTIAILTLRANIAAELVLVQRNTSCQVRVDIQSSQIPKMSKKKNAVRSYLHFKRAAQNLRTWQLQADKWALRVAPPGELWLCAARRRYLNRPVSGLIRSLVYCSRYLWRHVTRCFIFVAQDGPRYCQLYAWFIRAM